MARQRGAAGATALMAGSLVTVAICRFVRNVILARLLTPTDFGVGAAFALTITFLELLSDFGPQKQLVQAERGNDAEWVNSAHLLLFIRGSLLALVYFAAAEPFALWFQTPQAVDAFRWLALTPLLRNLEHCDPYRFQRELKLGRLSILQAAPELLSLAIAPWSAWYFGDFRAFLVVTLVSASVRTALSHLVSERPYRWRWEPAIVRSMFAFGWPLIGNGLMLFLILHGERFLVATFFDNAMLGAYSVVFMLAISPTTLIARLHSSVALPLFARAKQDPQRFHEVFRQSSQLMCLAAAIMAILFVGSGEWLVTAVFDERYLLAVEAAPWIGMMCAMRIARTTLNISSMGLGDTRLGFYANLFRAALFGVCLLALTQGASLLWVPITGFLGELGGYFVSLALLKRFHRVHVGIHARSLAAAIALAAAAIFLEHSGIRYARLSTPVAATGAVLLLCSGCVLMFSELRSTLAGLFRSTRGWIR